MKHKLPNMVVEKCLMSYGSVDDTTHSKSSEELANFGKDSLQTQMETSVHMSSEKRQSSERSYKGRMSLSFYCSWIISCYWLSGTTTGSTLNGSTNIFSSFCSLVMSWNLSPKRLKAYCKLSSIFQSHNRLFFLHTHNMPSVCAQCTIWLSVIPAAVRQWQGSFINSASIENVPVQHCLRRLWPPGRCLLDTQTRTQRYTSTAFLLAPRLVKLHVSILIEISPLFTGTWHNGLSLTTKKFSHSSCRIQCCFFLDSRVTLKSATPSKTFT